jgi:hypothetical protein
MKNSELLSPNLSNSFLTLDDVLVAVNEFADTQEYAVIKERTKINKKEVIRKATLMCDKNEKMRSQDYEKRKTTIRFCECSFETVITLKPEG